MCEVRIVTDLVYDEWREAFRLDAFGTFHNLVRSLQRAEAEAAEAHKKLRNFRSTLGHFAEFVESNNSASIDQDGTLWANLPLTGPRGVLEDPAWLP